MYRFLAACGSVSGGGTSCSTGLRNIPLCLLATTHKAVTPRGCTGKRVREHLRCGSRALRLVGVSRGGDGGAHCIELQMCVVIQSSVHLIFEGLAAVTQCFCIMKPHSEGHSTCTLCAGAFACSCAGALLGVIDHKCGTLNPLLHLFISSSPVLKVISQTT